MRDERADSPFPVTALSVLAPAHVPRRFLASTWMTRQRAMEILSLFDRLGTGKAHELYLEGLAKVTQEIQPRGAR